jgi:hypothetical protein
MNTSALILMLCSMGTVTALTAYFFFRAFTTPPHSEPDSFSENDPA